MISIDNVRSLEVISPRTLLLRHSSAKADFQTETACWDGSIEGLQSQSYIEGYPALYVPKCVLLQL